MTTRSGLHRRLMLRAVWPCAIAAALFALAGSALLVHTQRQEFDARSRLLATLQAAEPSLAGNPATLRAPAVHPQRSRPSGAVAAAQLQPTGEAERGALAVRQRRAWLLGLVGMVAAMGLAWLSQRWLSQHIEQPLRELADTLGIPHEQRGRDLRPLRDGAAMLRRRLDESHREAECRIRASVAEALQRAAEAQTATRGKAQFLAAVGDRLRQPLHAMNLFIGALGNDAQPSQRLPLSRLHDSAQAMVGLLEELLELSRLDAHVIQADLRPQQVSALFAACRQSLLARDRKCAAVLHWRDGGLWLHSDAELIGRMLHHLTANALDHCGNGRVLVAARRSGGGVRLEVRDNGTGIARIHQSQIFEEFFSLNGGDDRQRRRLGLGLPICARIAALLGTGIGLRSELGRGSVFWIELPRAAADASAQVAAPAQQSVPSTPE